MSGRARAMLGVLGVVCVSAGAETLYVRPDGTGDYPTIQAAVDAATDGDVIVLADGVFRGDGNRNIRVDYKNVTITSESGDPTRTVIDCEDAASGHCAWMIRWNPVQVVIEGMSMIHGDGGTSWSGGAASVSESWRVVFRNCIFAGNRAYYGGAIAGRWCEISIVSCTFYDNEATASGGGAALAMDDLGSAELSHCIVAFGRAGRAFESLGATITLECCDVYGNAGGDYAGPITGQLGVNGNISADPLFCDPARLDLSIATGSPCAPGGECGLMGALSIGCGPTPAEATTWGAIKGLYRSE